MATSSFVEQNCEAMVRRARTAFRQGRPRRIHFREAQLQSLLRLLDENEQLLLDSVYADLRKPPMETALNEMDVIRNEVNRALHQIWDWSKPVTPTKGFLNLLDTVQVQEDPYGVVLIIGTWTYPLLLLLRPFIGALAAGNCVLLKPSEVVASTALLIADLIDRYLDSECYQVFNGGATETSVLLKQRFDYVFYTGCEDIGRSVLEEMNHNLTPVSMILGSKCPTFVDDNVDLSVTAKRIIWGKLLNAGQTFIAPDYLLCSKQIEDQLVAALRQAMLELLGPQPKTSSFYSRILDDAHYEHLVHLIANGNIALGGNCDPYERYIEPTVLTNVTEQDAIMQEEIHGPILPVINVSSVEEAVAFIANREKALAVYVFTNSKATIDHFLMGTSSGAIVVNDVGIQLNTANVPFGGVGKSGFGAIGGKCTFDLFTHRKTCIIRNLGPISEKLNLARYPPYPQGKVRLLRMMSKPRNYPQLGWMKNYLIFCLGVAVAAAYYYYSK